jgi:ribosomal protein S18 acetylase RimI-like enzyme
METRGNGRDRRCGWETLSTEPIFQLVCDADALPEMLALIGETKPGPFGPLTCELGLYVRIRDAKDDRLIAVGGERLRTGGHVELSAIAVHPRARGRGLGGAVTAYLARAAIARGEIPFLHVFPSNPAVGLYQRIGFRKCTMLWVIWNRSFIEPVAVFIK